jgi:hypothetical protein
MDKQKEEAETDSSSSSSSDEERRGGNTSITRRRARPSRAVTVQARAFLEQHMHAVPGTASMMPSSQPPQGWGLLLWTMGRR